MNEEKKNLTYRFFDTETGFKMLSFQHFLLDYYGEYNAETNPKGVEVFATDSELLSKEDTKVEKFNYRFRIPAFSPYIICLFSTNAEKSFRYMNLSLNSKLIPTSANYNTYLNQGCISIQHSYAGSDDVNMRGYGVSCSEDGFLISVYGVYGSNDTIVNRFFGFNKASNQNGYFFAFSGSERWIEAYQRNAYTGGIVNNATYSITHNGEVRTIQQQGAEVYCIRPLSPNKLSTTSVLYDENGKFKIYPMGVKNISDEDFLRDDEGKYVTMNNFYRTGLSKNFFDIYFPGLGVVTPHVSHEYTTLEQDMTFLFSLKNLLEEENENSN